MQAESNRKIIHVDMDAFFASVEQLDHPELRGKPVAVGGTSERGVVAAASYEARKFGVRSAMSSKVAKRKCPDLIFVKHRFDRYKEISSQIRTIFLEYTDLVEPLSLDEAYLDVTYTKKGRPSATLIAKEIRQRIFNETGLTASAGVSYNKFLAKVASDVNKPNGMFVVTPDKAQAFIDQLEIRKFFGIGKVTAKKLNEMGVWYGRDLKLIDRLELTRMFGKAGNYYYDICRGIDNREVQPSRERKSVGAENTFSQDLFREEELKKELLVITEKVWERASRSGVKAKTVTLKFKYADFEQHTRSKTLEPFIVSKEIFIRESLKLIKLEGGFVKGIRLLGLTLSNFLHEQEGEIGVQLVIEF
ncbi:DNA polymerase IV [Draconibacterium sp. IB214405]|uniref:DNA polymerase IV n=1 Tax=Draconibacterium sp. IB214405 TaxID=3097352 RepID=UPI002A107824|nr:DNA polymerase IV [Draconibacterium sp. IB214405]MDX8341047.1 DNA polymerase IV [Draconibacterium sp. IB214405]